MNVFWGKPLKQAVSRQAPLVQGFPLAILQKGGWPVRKDVRKLIQDFLGGPKSGPDAMHELIASAHKAAVEQQQVTFSDEDDDYDDSGYVASSMKAQLWDEFIGHHNGFAKYVSKYYTDTKRRVRVLRTGLDGRKIRRLVEVWKHKTLDCHIAICHHRNDFGILDNVTHPDFNFIRSYIPNRSDEAEGFNDDMDEGYVRP